MCEKVLRHRVWKKDQPRAAGESTPMAALTLLCTYALAEPCGCLSIFLLILVRVLIRGDRQKRRRESRSLSQKTVVVKLVSDSKRAYRRTEESGSEVWKWMLSHQQSLRLTMMTEDAVWRFRRRHLHKEKAEGWVRMWGFTIANVR